MVEGIEGASDQAVVASLDVAARPTTVGTWALIISWPLAVPYNVVHDTLLG